MIHVTQGHEKGIGLEVFLKSFVELKNGHNQFILYACLNAVSDTAKSINLQFKVEDNRLIFGTQKLQFININDDSLPNSTSALLRALENIEYKSDILFTLPTSKDQLINPINNQKLHGYTEFLRHWFKSNELSMCFLSPEHSVCLITDHIPLKEVASSITKKLIINKVTNAIETINKLRNIKNIYIAGINPHCGEGGLLGTEDQCVVEATYELTNIYPQLKVLGPLAGDTLQFYHQDAHDLLVYMYHDQGLAPFKFINKLIGINITCGLPFIRVSVDHGTSFNLYGKNAADSSGCLYLMNELIK